MLHHESDSFLENNAYYEKRYRFKLPDGENILKSTTISNFFGNLSLDSNLINEIEAINIINQRIDEKNIYKIQDREIPITGSGKLILTEKSMFCIYPKICYKIPLESIVWLIKKENINKTGIFDYRPSAIFNVILKDNSVKSFGFDLSCFGSQRNEILDEIRSDIIKRREELTNIINESDNFEFEDPLFIKEPEKPEEIIQLNPEYKRTCKMCGKVWYSSIAQEKEIEIKNKNDGIQSALNSILDHSARAQYQKNIQDGKKSLASLKSCPVCHSHNYDEAIIEFAPPIIDESENKKENQLDQSQNNVDEDPEKLLKLRLAKGEITIDEYKELKELLS